MTTTKQGKRSLDDIGRTAYASIAELVAALQCDYERLAELRDNRESWESRDDSDAESWDDDPLTDSDDVAELAELEEAAGDCADEDEARERIEEDALSVEVRSGWCLIGGVLEPDEYRILLTTGGPAVQITGELGRYGTPETARLEVQDWFLPWTEYADADEGVLLAYVNCFAIGECY